MQTNIVFTPTVDGLRCRPHLKQALQNLESPVDAIKIVKRIAYYLTSDMHDITAQANRYILEIVEELEQLFSFSKTKSEKYH